MKIKSLSDIPDLAPVEPGEYDLYIRQVKDTVSKKTGRKGIMFIIDIQGVDNALSIVHSIWPPNEADDEDKAETMWRMIKEFITALGLDPNEENENSDFEGLNFTAMVTFDAEFNANKLGKITG